MKLYLIKLRSAATLYKIGVAEDPLNEIEILNRSMYNRSKIMPAVMLLKEVELTDDIGEEIGLELSSALSEFRHKPMEKYVGGYDVYQGSIEEIKAVVNKVVKAVKAKYVLEGTLPDWALSSDELEQKVKLSKLASGLQ